MALIDVVKRLDKRNFEIVTIDEDKDVIHIFVEDGVLHYQTIDGAVYSDITILEEKERSKQGSSYIKVERGHLANLDKMVYYDPVKKNAYYEPFPARKNAPYTPIGKPYVKLLEDHGIPFLTEEDESGALFKWRNKTHFTP